MLQPPGWVLEPARLPGKSVADAVEALVGAMYLREGCDAAHRFLHHVGVLKDLSFPPFRPLVDTRLGPDLLDTYARSLAPVELRIGHTFRSKALLVQAFTHASFTSAVTPPLDRLAFLGSALLEFLVTRHNYASYPDLQPNDLHGLRIACANSEFRAEIARTNQLHRYVFHESPPLMRDIVTFVDVPDTAQASNPYESDFCPPTVIMIARGCPVTTVAGAWRRVRGAGGGSVPGARAGRHVGGGASAAAASDGSARHTGHRAGQSQDHADRHVSAGPVQPRLRAEPRHMCTYGAGSAILCSWVQ